MIEKPMDVLTAFPIRKTKKQKQSFRDAVVAYAKSLDYPCEVESQGKNIHNIVIGDPKTAKYLITAHYDTPPRLLFPNFITPQNVWMYLAYQFFVVMVFVLVAMVVGVSTGLLLNHVEIGSLTAGATYWILLGMMLHGPANKNNANDNTSGVVTVLETAKSLPSELRDRVCFILFDLEETGLNGSAAYQKKHKVETKDQLVLNCDCVGDGDEIVMFPTKKLKKDSKIMEYLRQCTMIQGQKRFDLHQKGFYVYPSDQKSFPYGVGIAAFRRHPIIGLYCDKIHTNKDTVLDEENVCFLRDRLIALVSGDA